MKKPPDPEHSERGQSRAVEPTRSDAPAAEPAPGARPCQMMLDAFTPRERPCGVAPTVGGNGLYRYCKSHLLQVESAGGVVYRDGWA